MNLYESLRQKVNQVKDDVFLMAGIVTLLPKVAILWRAHQTTVIFSDRSKIDVANNLSTGNPQDVEERRKQTGAVVVGDGEIVEVVLEGPEGPIGEVLVRDVPKKENRPPRSHVQVGGPESIFEQEGPDRTVYGMDDPAIEINIEGKSGRVFVRDRDFLEGVNIEVQRP